MTLLENFCRERALFHTRRNSPAHAPTPLRYRSKKRVPTHYTLLHGGAMSICRLVQAAGRAHGEQASRLRANGFDRVKILTLAHDFDTVKNYPSFLEVHCPPHA